MYSAVGGGFSPPTNKKKKITIQTITIMTTKDIKKFTILAECTEGRYILADTKDPVIIQLAGTALKWSRIKPGLVENISLKEIMMPADEDD